MRALHIIWTLFWNLVALAIFAGMLAVASKGFQTIVVAGLVLIYVTVLTYGTHITRTQLSQARMSVEHYVQLARMIGDDNKQAEVDDVERTTKEAWAEYENKNVLYYINMSFVFVIWLVSVIAIINSL